MIAAIHQPQYLPWSGYWDKMARSDIFVLLDNVQYKKNEWQNRNRIKSPDGWQWLTVPIHYRYGQRISEVTIDNTRGWRRKQKNAIRFSYARSPHFDTYEEGLVEHLDFDWDKLADLNVDCIRMMREKLGIETELVMASELGRMPEEPTERLVWICRELGADVYLSGSGAREYLDVKRFVLSDIEVVFQDYTPPVYPQHSGEFAGGLSAVDILFNCGPDSLLVIKSGNSQHTRHLTVTGRMGENR